MSIRIVIPGFLSTIQDLGRTGYQASGFPPSGAADPDALRYGNMLVGNAENEAGLEMTVQGITAEFTESCVIALTGADMSPTVNDKEIPMWRAVEIQAGDVLRCGYVSSGFRTYLSVAGGFDIPETLGSRSTSIKISFGGFNGRKLEAGDELPLRLPVGTLPDMNKRATYTRHYRKTVTLRALPGPQEDMFTEEALKTFFSEEYKVSSSLDRMGIRLEGPKIEASERYDIVSDGITTGSIQVPSSGQPIILMCDRQTTGGYTKIAAVISSDISLCAQLAPGSAVKFKEVTIEEAQAAAREDRNRFLSEYAYMNPWKKITV